MAESMLGSRPVPKADTSLSAGGIRSRVASEPDLRQDHPLRGRRGASLAEEGGESNDGIFLVFPDPTTRVFLFHLRQVLTTLLSDDQRDRCLTWKGATLLQHEHSRPLESEIDLALRHKTLVFVSRAQPHVRPLSIHFVLMIV